MNFSYIKKLIFIVVISIFAIPFSVYAQQAGGATTFSGKTPSTSTFTTNTETGITTGTNDCEIISAEFSPFTNTSSTTQAMEGFYKSNIVTPIIVTITTKDCAQKKIKVSLMEKDKGPGVNIFDSLTGDDPVSILNNKELTVGPDEQIIISLQAGESECETGQTIQIGNVFPDCVYYLHIENSNGVVFETMDDNLVFKHAGMLAYECDVSDIVGTIITVTTAGTQSGCLDDWKYTGDTSLKDSSSVTLEEAGSLTDPNSACGDNPDCYELFAGFGKALGEKFATVKPSSLGDFINMLIMFAIGIFGIILIVRIFLLGFQIAQDKKDGKVVALSDTKEELFKAIGGFILLLCIFIILRTINPDLLNLTPRIDALSLEVKSRTDDPNVKSYVDSIDTSEITSHPVDYDDETFLTYLGHQQGAAGAASILWAYHRGYSSIPNTTPFLSNASITNMRMQKNYFGSGTATPQAFLDYWWKKTEANKKKTDAIPEEINNVLKKVAADTNVSLKTIQVMCMIESFGCSNPNAVNGSYKGLFQMGPTEFATYKRTGATNIFDPYENAYAGAMYSKSNYSYIKNKWNKILP